MERIEVWQQGDGSLRGVRVTLSNGEVSPMFTAFKSVATHTTGQSILVVPAKPKVRKIIIRAKNDAVTGIMFSDGKKSISSWTGHNSEAKFQEIPEN